MLDKDIKEAYNKIKPTSDLEKRILDRINKTQNEKSSQQGRLLYKYKPLLACASIIIFMFIVYGSINMLNNRLIICDIAGNSLSKTESVIPTFDANDILNNSNSEEPFVISMRTYTEYISTVFQLNVDQKATISVNLGNVYIIDEQGHFINANNSFEIAKSTSICWAFENLGEDFNTQMLVKYKNKENIINLKYENGTFSAYII